MRYLWMALLIVILVLLVAFAVVNGQQAKVQFPFVSDFSITAPLFVVMILFYMLGMLSGGTVVGFLRKSYRKASEHSNR